MIRAKNYMEEIVFNIMDDVIKDMDMCTCEKCIMDIAAVALNNLPPKYVVTKEGEVYSKINWLRQQFEVDVVSEIIKAALIVKMNPKDH